MIAAHTEISCLNSYCVYVCVCPEYNLYKYNVINIINGCIYTNLLLLARIWALYEFNEFVVCQLCIPLISETHLVCSPV